MWILGGKQKPDQLCAGANGVIATKTRSCTLPLPGIMADVVNEQGKKCEEEEAGTLVIKRPYPSMLRTIWGDPNAIKTIFRKNTMVNTMSPETRHYDKRRLFLDFRSFR